MTSLNHPISPFISVVPKARSDSQVDVRFVSRLPHPPTLALVKHIAASATLPDDVSYIGQEGFEAVSKMQLVTMGRLSELSYFHLSMLFASRMSPARTKGWTWYRWVAWGWDDAEVGDIAEEQAYRQSRPPRTMPWSSSASEGDGTG